ncbi:hypothetical protein NVP1074O_37 [Vibrio phage 1.074.O._10N.222.49.B7]|nr:hypothetical protein NVP1074O_37 [Vibrio phage 1.074.O._10N.222.49.B7]
MGKISDLNGWGIYSEFQKFQHFGLWCFTTKFTDTSGIDYWRWYVSHRSDTKNLCYLWKDRNAKARKIETRYFLNESDCIEHAKAIARDIAMSEGNHQS